MVLCSQCKREANGATSYNNKITKEIWCQTCVAKIKKKRNYAMYTRTLRGKK